MEIIWWTKTIPSSPGYYFFHDNKGFAGIVKVYQSYFDYGLCAYFPGVKGGISVKVLDGWWSDKEIKIPERKE